MRALSVDMRIPLTREVASGGLDLDDIGAGVRENSRRDGSGDGLFERHNPDSG